MEIEKFPREKLFSRRKNSLVRGGSNLNIFTDDKEETSSIVEPKENEEMGNNSWRGQGGGKTSLRSVQFDKQMDNISLWLEGWDHQTVSTQ